MVGLKIRKWRLPLGFLVGSCLWSISVLTQGGSLSNKIASYKAYSHMDQFFKNLDPISPILTTPSPEIAPFVPDRSVFVVNTDQLTHLLDAAAQDNITALKMLAFIGIFSKTHKCSVYLSGKVIRETIEGHFTLGLTLPRENIDHLLYIPDSEITEEVFQAHLKVIYSRRYVHRFEKETLDADLVIGTDETVTYLRDGVTQTGYVVTADVYYGQTSFGFQNVHGVGGKKRGLLGLLQRIFFIPQGIKAMMVVDDDLRIDAFIDQIVTDFEENPIYDIRRIDR